MFFDKAGMALRGTFLVDVDGVIQFAEANGPGEARDQAAWKRAVAALPARTVLSAGFRLRPGGSSTGPRVRYSPAAPWPVGLPFRARSSAGEHPVYTRAVGGSKPSAPTRVGRRLRRSRQAKGEFRPVFQRRDPVGGRHSVGVSSDRAVQDLDRLIVITEGITEDDGVGLRVHQSRRPSDGRLDRLRGRSCG